MAPPPLPQQGSRAGLITAVVIFVLTTFIGGGLAVYNYMEAEQKTKDIESQKATIAKLADPTDMADPRLQQILTTPATGGVKTTMWRAMNARTDELSKAITGKVDEYKASVDASKDARETVRYRLNGVEVKFDPDSLTATATALADEVVRKNQEIAKLKETVDEVEKSKVALIEANKGEVAQHVTAVKKVEDEKVKIAADVQTFQANTATAVQAAQATNTQQIQAVGEEKNQLVVQLNAKVQELEKLKKDIEGYKKVLQAKRLNPQVPILRQVDGVIAAVSNISTVYINLGMGDQVMPGLTFEVYDRNEGVPKEATMSEDALPIGKGSIEVIKVGQNSSECRVVRAPAEGAAFVPGDMIANLVYDKNTKFNFVVCPGEGFDLAQTGRPSVRDGEVLKGLIRRWGGAVQEVPMDKDGFRVSIDADFLILGKEPVVPKADPNNAGEVFISEKKKKELERYESVRTQAMDLHIPVLNQNRFLYFIGYFDQAKR